MKIWIYDQSCKEMLEGDFKLEGFEVFLLEVKEHEKACDHLKSLISTKDDELKKSREFIADLKSRFLMLEKLKESNLTLQNVAIADIEDFLNCK